MISENLFSRLVSIAALTVILSGHTPARAGSQNDAQALKTLIVAGTFETFTAGLTVRNHSVSKGRPCSLTTLYIESKNISDNIFVQRVEIPLDHVDPDSIELLYHLSLKFRSIGGHKKFKVISSSKPGRTMTAQGHIPLKSTKTSRSSMLSAFHRLVKACQ